MSHGNRTMSIVLFIVDWRQCQWERKALSSDMFVHNRKKLTSPWCLLLVFQLLNVRSVLCHMPAVSVISDSSEQIDSPRILTQFCCF